jgi:hypothetical protein
MPNDAPAKAAALLPARLLIHSNEDAGADACGVGGGSRGGGILARALRRLLHHDSGAVRLRVDDLQGRQVFAAAGARVLVDVPLPAGTYHISVHLGEQRRRYTVALEQGATFDLCLRPVKEWL